MLDDVSPGLVPGTGEGLPGLERKFMALGAVTEVEDGTEISGYASLFGDVDQGGDVVQPGAYASSLKTLKVAGRQIKGRILNSVEKGREAAALIAAGAIDGLSIGYRTVKASKNSKGQRLLSELELWEVSLVTFPMLPSARVGAKGDFQPLGDVLREMAAAFQDARQQMAQAAPVSCETQIGE